MKIAFLGNFQVPYSSESHYLWTLKFLGHEVMPLQEGHVNTREVLDTALQCDMFFWVHTHNWVTPGALTMGDVLEQLRQHHIPSFGYHLDLWMGIQREKDLKTDDYWKVDFFFCTDKLMVEYLNRTPGMPKSFYLPAGVVEKECYLGTPKDEYKYDVIFVGSKGYHPEWPYRPKLVNWLAETYGEKFAHFGGDGKGTIRGESLNDLYASAKIVVGDTLCLNFNYPFYFSDRLFETIGRGGFMIFPYIEGVCDMFNSYTHLPNTPKPEGVELITYPFDDFEQLKRLIDTFLTNPSIRERIRKSGFERVKREHTYTKRLSDILVTVLQNKK
jgi:hypothetical protein